MKTLFVLLFGLLALGTKPVNNEPVVEIVIYKVKKDQLKNMDGILKQVRAELSKMPGYIDYQTFKSNSKEGVFMDLCRWESIEVAHNAAKKVELMPEFAEFFGVFEEIVMMDHFESLNK